MLLGAVGDAIVDFFSEDVFRVPVEVDKDRVAAKFHEEKKREREKRKGGGAKVFGAVVVRGVVGGKQESGGRSCETAGKQLLASKAPALPSRTSTYSLRSLFFL